MFHLVEKKSYSSCFKKVSNPRVQIKNSWKGLSVKLEKLFIQTTTKEQMWRQNTHKEKLGNTRREQT